jgi:antitoxin component YwqK of YwqJK toxin-antitoxin module
MKLLYYVQCLFLISSLVFSQKNNYNTFVAFEDEHLDQIMFFQRYVSSGSDALFYGNVKSVTLKKFYADGKQLDTPNQSFFDSNRNLIQKIVFFPDHQKNTSFYFLPKYNGNPIFKESFQIHQKDTIYDIKSEIDSFQRFIRTTHFYKEKIIKLDSIFYVDNFFPTEIRTYENMQRSSVYKALYFKNGKLHLSTTIRNTKQDKGNLFHYNELGQLLSSCTFHGNSFEDIFRMEPSIEKLDEKKDACVNDFTIAWKDSKSFVYTEKNGDFYQYDEKTRTLEILKNGGKTLAYFNQDGLPIQYISSDERYKIKTEVLYGYNDKKDLISQKVLQDGQLLSTTTFQYLYDSQKNWTERKEFENGKLLTRTQRVIAYHSLRK